MFLQILLDYNIRMVQSRAMKVRARVKKGLIVQFALAYDKYKKIYIFASSINKVFRMSNFDVS